MTTSTRVPAPGLAPGAAGPVWHTLSADRVLQAEKVDEQSGLSSAEAASRLEQFGPNKFDAGTAEPRWRAFLRQYADLMQLVLLVAGLVSLLLQEWETGIVLIVLTLFNAVLGLQQEGKAAAAVTALRKNQMTAVQMAVVGRRYTIEGKGYSTDGQITRVGGQAEIPLDQFLLPMVLASDAVLSDGELIGGWPDLVQNPMQLECQLASSGIYVGGAAGWRDPRVPQLEAGAAEWMLLLQIDTDDEVGWMWGDVGTLYYWIRRPDLAAGRFDRVWMIFQCC